MHIFQGTKAFKAISFKALSVMPSHISLTVSTQSKREIVFLLKRYRSNIHKLLL